MGKSYTGLFEVINLLPNVREEKCIATKFSTEDISYIRNDADKRIESKSF